ncbi:MAG: hypothetical protein GY821_12770 [Gammaproteobacteria bacterium]|nr:hypothetical protein [Gammaproteobacteria bacterium]
MLAIYTMTKEELFEQKEELIKAIDEAKTFPEKHGLEATLCIIEKYIKYWEQNNTCAGKFIPGK